MNRVAGSLIAAGFGILSFGACSNSPEATEPNPSEIVFSNNDIRIFTEAWAAQSLANGSGSAHQEFGALIIGTYETDDGKLVTRQMTNPLRFQDPISPNNYGYACLEPSDQVITRVFYHDEVTIITEGIVEVVDFANLRQQPFCEPVPTDQALPDRLP